MCKYKNIIIGATGFIGTVLCKQLLDNGESILGVSRNERHDFCCDNVVCDIGNKKALKNVLKGGENIFILTGQISVNFNKENELKNLKNIIESLDKESTKKVIYFSSVLVYGEMDYAVMESDNAFPMDEYGKFKLEAENFLMSESSKNDWILGIMRLANVYGNPQNKGFIGFIMNQIMNNNLSISINGDGNQLRDYIFINDVADAIVYTCQKLKESDIINIATGKSYTLIDLVNTINDNLTQKIEYKILNNKVNEIKKSIISNEKLVGKYGFIPRYDLSDGIKKTFLNYNRT